jgi:hypothetical protein
MALCHQRALDILFVLPAYCSLSFPSNPAVLEAFSYASSLLSLETSPSAFWHLWQASKRHATLKGTQSGSPTASISSQSPSRITGEALLQCLHEVAAHLIRHKMLVSVKKLQARTLLLCSACLGRVTPNLELTGDLTDTNSERC